MVLHVLRGLCGMALLCSSVGQTYQRCSSYMDCKSATAGMVTSTRVRTPAPDTLRQCLASRRSFWTPSCGSV